MFDWQWKPRFDLDLFQRCLTIIVLSVLTRSIVTPILQLFGLQCLAHAPLDLLTIVLLIGAIIRSSLQLNPDGKSVLITGCDTGFGFETAKSMHALGLKVFAGCLNKQGQGGQELAAMGIDVLQLDVTKEDQWDEAVKHIKLHSTGLWGLVNNAGWSTFGDVEWVPMDIYRKIADINIFGLLLALKKITPLIRSSKGRIVTVTSGLTRGPAPNRSAYVLTKYAGVGLMECLRYEMARFGVKVSMIEPGNYLAATKLFDKSIIGKQADFMWQQMSDEVKSAYGEVEFRKKIALMDTYFQVGCKTVQPVVESYTNALLDVFPQVRYVPMDLGWRTRAFVYTHCPEGVFEWLYI